MKKTLSILLALAMLVCMIPSAAFAADAKVDISKETVKIVGITDEELTSSNGFSATKLYQSAGYAFQVSKLTVGGTELTGSAITTDFDLSVQKGGTSYSASNGKVTDAGTYTVTIKAKDTSTSYSGQITCTLTIKPVNLTGATVRTTGGEFTSADVSGGKIKDAVLSSHIQVQQSDGLIVPNDMLTLSSTVTGSSVNVTATTKSPDGTNIISSSASTTFTLKTDIGGGTYEIAPIPDQTFTGAEIKPSVTVRAKNGGSILSTYNYTVTYSNNTDAGTATVTVRAEGTFAGTLTQTFTILPKNISNTSSIQVNDAIYNGGNAITPTAVIIDGSRVLVEGTDYQISTTATSIGAATATITGIRNYTGTITRQFNIVSAANGLVLGETAWLYIGNAHATDYQTEYNGTAQTPSVVVRIGPTESSAQILPSNYYRLTWTNNTKPGQATVVVTGQNGYAGSLVGTFMIMPCVLTQFNTTLSGLNASYPYTGLPITPLPTVTVNGRQLVKDTDYTLTYSNNTNHSTAYYKAKITITGMGGYIGSVYTEFSIAGKSLAGLTASFTDGRSSSAYTGQAIAPKVTVRDGYTTLKEGSDYTITYRNSLGQVTTSIKDAGTYTVIITGIGSYSGELTLTYTINGTDISGYTVHLSQTKAQADGKPKTVTVLSVTNGTTTLLSSDYVVTYQDASGKTVTSMVDAGTYRVVVTGKNGYMGSAYATFTIEGTKQSMTFSNNQTAYKKYVTSDPFTITVNVDGDGTGINVTSGNTSVATVTTLSSTAKSLTVRVDIHRRGRAKLTFTTVGNKFSEPAVDDVYVKVYPNRAVLSRKPWTPSGQKGVFRVRWDVQPDVDKYQVMYCRNSSFRSGTYKTKTVSASELYSTQSTLISNVTRGARYYVKVRAIVEVTSDTGSTLKYYGNWSKWRSVVVK